MTKWLRDKGRILTGKFWLDKYTVNALIISSVCVSTLVCEQAQSFLECEYRSGFYSRVGLVCWSVFLI